MIKLMYICLHTEELTTSYSLQILTLVKQIKMCYNRGMKRPTTKKIIPNESERRQHAYLKTAANYLRKLTSNVLMNDCVLPAYSDLQ